MFFFFPVRGGDRILGAFARVPPDRKEQLRGHQRWHGRGAVLSSHATYSDESP